MKVNINKLPKSEVEIEIIVPPEEWHEFLDEAAKELSYGLKIEGFRPGHAPLNLVEQKIGMAKILEEAAEHCVHKCYVRAILENNIEAIGKPEISVTKIAKDNPFEFKAKVAVMPEVILPDYKKIAKDFQKERKAVEVKKEEVDKSIDWLLKSRAKYITVTKPAQQGNRVEIDFEGEVAGEKLAELSSKTHPAILGKGYFVPGFEENLVGMKEGEKKEFKVAFPTEFDHKHLAGKEVIFKVKMNLVQEAEFPKFDDDFAKNVGNFKDAQALSDNIKEGLRSEKEKQEKNRWRDVLIEKIAEASKMEIPPVLVEAESVRMLEELKERILEVGLSYESYLEKFKKEEKEILREFADQAKKRVAAFLSLNEIAKQENIEVPESELTEEMNKAFARFGSVKEAQKQIDTEKLKGYTRDILRNEKVFQALEKI